MKNRLLFLLLTVLAFFSCTKEDNDLRLSDFNAPTIRGYYLRDYTGFDIGVVGNPNVKRISGFDYSSSEYSFTFYPNPLSDFCNISLKIPVNAQTVKLWITQASYCYDTSDNTIDINNTNNVVIGGSPLFQNEFPAGSMIGLNLSQLPDGYYRIYLKVDDCLLYDNLVIYDHNE